MTNFRWEFSVSAMKADLDLIEFIVLNDFTAVAMSLPALKQTELVQIGEGHADQFKPMAVLGAGTGLGVAHLIPTALGYLPLPGEGGHVDFTAQTEQEWFIHRFLANKRIASRATGVRKVTSSTLMPPATKAFAIGTASAKSLITMTGTTGPCANKTSGCSCQFSNAIVLTRHMLF